MQECNLSQHDPWTLSLCQRTGATAMSSVLAPSFLLELGAYAIAAAGIRLIRNRSCRARQQEAQEHPETIYQVSASRASSASSEAVCTFSAAVCARACAHSYGSSKDFDLTIRLYNSTSMYIAAYKSQSHWSEPS